MFNQRHPNRRRLITALQKSGFIQLSFGGNNGARAVFNFRTPEHAPKSRPVVRKPRPAFLAQTESVRIVTILSYRPPVARLPGHAIETPMDVLRRAHRNSRRAHGCWW